MRVRRVVVALTVFAGLVAGPVAAVAQPTTGDLVVRVRDAALQDDGSTRLLVSITGPAAEGRILEASELTVREDGTPVDGLTVTPLLESDPTAVGVVLAVDVSGSTAGPPIEAARTAAVSFAEEVTGAGGQVGVVSFGPDARLIAPLTTDAAVLRTAIAGLEAAGETALYDGVALAAGTLADFEGLRNIIVFSDGADTVSALTLDAAVAAAADAETPVTTVALATDALDPEAILAIAQGTGGQVIEAVDTTSLAGAFDAAAEAIASQYVVTYVAAPAESEDLELTVAATLGAATAEDTLTVVNPRRTVSSGPAPAPVAAPPVPPTPEVLWVGLAATFLALVLLLGMVVSAVREESGSRRLQRRLGAYSRGGRARSRGRDLDATELSRRAGAVMGHLPRPAGFDAALQQRIDRAAWPLRANEFLAIQLGASLVGALVGWALSGAAFVGVVGLAVGWFVPRVILDRTVRKRSDAFLEQLPDTLGLLAGSLKAGYGLVQAVDTVVRETPAPTSEEFGRVLTETRLGMPLPEALEGMAERTGNEDFGWVVMAINIQSQVGGNLAQLLETVSATLRDRAQLRRQVRSLSAEGKLSAYVLLGMVPALGFYMSLVNPAYVRLLWTTSMGRTMSMVGLALLGVGVVGIKKVITIDV